MTDRRSCEQCGTAFEPRREHKRFFPACCLVTWNREKTSGRQIGDTALGGSVTAMADTAQRLDSAGIMDVPQALAVISEAVWWFTIVDATMIRYHRGAYNRALAALDPAARRTAEGTFTGLRFVRNQTGYRAAPDDFIQPQPTAEGAGNAPVAAWTWKPVPTPAPGLMPPRGKTWETSRRREYWAQLAGHPAGDTIARAATFLTQVYTAAGHARLSTRVWRSLVVALRSAPSGAASPLDVSAWNWCPERQGARASCRTPRT